LVKNNNNFPYIQTNEKIIIIQMKFITKNLKKLLITILVLSVICQSLEKKNTMKSKEPTVSFNRSTGGNDWGNNNVFYLDRHDVNCNRNEALQGFRFYRPRWNQIAYYYTCKSDRSISSGNTYNDSTRLNATAGNKQQSANYLDRHKCTMQIRICLTKIQIGKKWKQNKLQF